MNQPQLSAQDFFPEASDLILSLTSEEADELMKTLRPLAVMPENHDEYRAARLRFVIYGRLRKLAHEAAKVVALLIVFLGLLGSAHAQRIPTIYIDGPEDADLKALSLAPAHSSCRDFEPTFCHLKGHHFA